MNVHDNLFEVVEMELNGVEIEDTFAEAFDSFYSRFLITAISKKWAKTAAMETTGFASSLIGCSAEAGIEKYMAPRETPDGRPGYVIQVWAFKKKMAMELIHRIGQNILTCPTTAVFNMLDSEEKLDTGAKMKYFGDGFEEERKLYSRDMIAVPIMMGEFLIEKELGMAKGVAGGNIIILANDQASALMAAEAASEAVEGIDGVIAPFPGGIVASGSKVGSKKYKFMDATTNEKYCPTLKDKVDSALSNEVNAVSELVLDGVTEEAVKEAMKAGIYAASKIQGVVKITAGNYGGTLGKVHIHLKDLI